MFLLFFFFNDTATTEIYTLSLHDALPISRPRTAACITRAMTRSSITPDLSIRVWSMARIDKSGVMRSEEHTSELQSHSDLVCRLLLEKKKKILVYFDIGYLERSTLRVEPI